jgi:hypothetical protein
MPSRRDLLLTLGAVAATGALMLGGGGADDDDDLAESPDQPGRTRGFVRLAGRLPWVADLGRTCGRFSTFRDGLEGIGSCVLLDEFGTIALTAHQVEDWPVGAADGVPHIEASVAFSPRPGAWVRSQGIEALHFHSMLDLGLATIDPGFVRDNGLEPIRWGSLPQWFAGVEVVATGWAHGRTVLHAADGPCLGFTDLDREEYTSLTRNGRMGQFLCKTEAAISAHPGMSGGGVFLDGAFVGMDNANSPAGDVPRLRFTPSWAVWQAYSKFHPERAAIARFGRGLRPDGVPMPLSCRPLDGWKAVGS